jgi:hypothetical protein
MTSIETKVTETLTISSRVIHPATISLGTITASRTRNSIQITVSDVQAVNHPTVRITGTGHLPNLAIRKSVWPEGGDRKKLFSDPIQSFGDVIRIEERLPAKFRPMQDCRTVIMCVGSTSMDGHAYISPDGMISIVMYDSILTLVSFKPFTLDYSANILAMDTSLPAKVKIPESASAPVYTPAVEPPAVIDLKILNAETTISKMLQRMEKFEKAQRGMTNFLLDHNHEVPIASAGDAKMLQRITELEKESTAQRGVMTILLENLSAVKTDSPDAKRQERDRHISEMEKKFAGGISDLGKELTTLTKLVEDYKKNKAMTDNDRTGRFEAHIETLTTLCKMNGEVHSKEVATRTIMLNDAVAQTTRAMNLVAALAQENADLTAKVAYLEKRINHIETEIDSAMFVVAESTAAESTATKE